MLVGKRQNKEFTESRERRACAQEVNTVVAVIVAVVVVVVGPSIYL